MHTLFRPSERENLISLHHQRPAHPFLTCYFMLPGVPQRRLRLVSPFTAF